MSRQLANLAGLIVALHVAVLGVAPAAAEPVAADSAGARAGNHVTFRPDHTLLLNGKPFFPVGIYYPFEEAADPTGRGLDHLKALGFNLLFTVGKPDRASLDRIAARGMYVWYRIDGMFGDHDALRKFLTQYKDHPAVLAWEHEDEPILNRANIERSRKGYELVKQLDPDHPVICVQAPNPDHAALFPKWAEISDISAFDEYPVPLQRWEDRAQRLGADWPYSIAVMGRLTRQWQAWGGGKPVLTVLQAFSWDPLKYGRDGYPSYEQGRFMAYDSVINGAIGVSYFGRVVHEPRPATTAPAGSAEAARVMEEYTKSQSLNDWFWSYYGGVVQEVAAMGPVFTSPDAAWQPQVELAGAGSAGDADGSVEKSVKGLEWRVKQAAGGAVILLVNGSERPASLKITARPLAGRTLHCWNELRTIKVGGNGVLLDHVPPFGVRIYAEGAPPAGLE